MRPMHDDLLDALLAGTWRPALSITGAAGLPSPTDGGNVLRPLTAAKLSLRLPPTVGAAHAAKRLKETLEAEPPYGARVTFEAESPGDGWDAPATAPWLTDAMRRASEDYFGQPAMSQGTGGSIPFMAMLGARYPQAQFMITGVLGPDSNAHGPNEYLHAPTGVRVPACVAPRGAMLHPALERHVAVLHAHVDLARIQPRVVRHPLADVVADQLVRALAIVRPALGLRPRRQRRVAVAADAGADLPAGLGFAA